MRLTIITEDKTVLVNRVAYTVDMDWVPEIEGKKVWAVQWIDSEGEVEFYGPSENLKITKLGVFQKAIDLWNMKKEEADKLEQQRLEEEARLLAEQEEARKAIFISVQDDEIFHDTDADEDLFYDIEELLKEI